MLNKIAKFGLGIVPVLMFTAFLGASSTNANAATIGFGTCLEGGAACEGVKSQFSLLVVANGANQVDLTISNTGPLASSIAQIYLNNSAMFTGFVGGPAYTSTGASFSSIGVNPAALPGGAGYMYWSIAANSPAPTNGVNPGESITYSLSVVAGTANNVVAAFLNGTIGMGLHVISVAPQGGSIAVVTIPNTPVPEPATMSLVGIGLLGLGMAGRKRFAKK